MTLGAGYFLPAGAPVWFFVLAAGIGLVLGGSQALSRSLFSHLVPSGKEAEYFSAYEMSDRGMSWLGPLLFGLTYQLTGSYRDAIISLVAFFVIGFVLLARVPVRQAIRDAGIPYPTGFSAGGQRPVVYAFGLPGVPLLRVKILKRRVTSALRCDKAGAGGYNKGRLRRRRMTRNGNLYRRPDVDRMTTTATPVLWATSPGGTIHE